MRKTSTFAVLGLLLAAPAAAPQDKEKSESHEAKKSITPLSVKLTFVKSQGDKKVSSLPYTLTCNTDDRRSSKLRMGIEVPIPVGPSTPVGPVSIQYRNVGTNIDCSATSVDGGRFKLELAVEQSSIYSAVEEKLRAAAAEPDSKSFALAVGDRPVFRTFSSNFSPLLRDGQTAQYTAATDPVSGEVVRVDVTLTVLK